MYVNATAIILSSRRAGEKDKRLGLYTRELGRLTALAVGAARPGAKLGPATEPPAESRFRLWTEREASHARVTGGGVEASFPTIRTDWRRMAVARFLCEWTERLTPLAHPQAEKYDLLRRALTLLETTDPEAVRLAFMVRFLALAGYNTSRDVSGLASTPEAASFMADRARRGLEEPVSLPPDFPAAYLRQQLLKFIAPLLHSPLRSVAHEEALKEFSSISRE
jgi:DNA repair protein RecO